jgi:hypothetical protein
VAIWYGSSAVPLPPEYCALTGRTEKHVINEMIQILIVVYPPTQQSVAAWPQG